MFMYIIFYAESGEVSYTWPKLPGDQSWTLEGVSGKYPDAVPYKVALAAGRWIYCHRDDHTLIRRQGMQPVTRVRGIRWHFKGIILEIILKSQKIPAHIHFR